MIIGSGFNSYSRAALIEELLSAGQKHRNLWHASALKNTAGMLKPMSRF